MRDLQNLQIEGVELELRMSYRGGVGPSLDRQITVQDVECLKEAFSLFDPNRKEEITPEELGKVKLFVVGVI